MTDDSGLTVTVMVMLRLMFTWLCWMILLPLMIDDAVLLDAQ
jgi:hypothetical protein